MKLLLANQPTSSKRHVFFFVVDATDGITAEIGEAGGQPEISTDGGAWTATGIGTLTHMGSGHYYAVLTQAAVATAGTVICTRYKSAATAEAPGTTVQVVAFDPDAVTNLGLTNLDGTVSSVASAVAAIGSGTGAALNFAALADNVLGAIEGVTFVGTQSSGTFASTAAEDGTRHVIVDSGGTPDLDIVYRFNVGAGRNAAKMTWKGIVTTNDTVTFQAWNGVSWDTRATYTGAGGSANVTREISLLATHTGTGSNAGRVLIRLVCSGQSAITVSTDEMLVAGVSVGQTVGYAGGAIWLDTLNGVAGSTPFINGTADNPVSTLADVLVLAASTNLTRVEVANGSTVTLTGTVTHFTFNGQHWTLVLNGQMCPDTTFIGAEVSGVCVADVDPTMTPSFVCCTFGPAITLPPCRLTRCGFEGTITFGSAGDYFFIDCYSEVAGTGTPVIDWAAGVGGTNLSMRRYSGGITFLNMLAGDRATVEGFGNVVVDASCNGASLVVRGTVSLTNNGTAMTVTETARTVPSTIWSSIVDTNLSAEQAMKLMSAVLGGKVSGAGSGSEIFRNVADTKNRVSATVDVDGNRTSVTTDLT